MHTFRILKKRRSDDKVPYFEVWKVKGKRKVLMVGIGSTPEDAAEGLLTYYNREELSKNEQAEIKSTKRIL